VLAGHVAETGSGLTAFAIDDEILAFARKTSINNHTATKHFPMLT
jgi:hypothetical protein